MRRLRPNCGCSKEHFLGSSWNFRFKRRWAQRRRACACRARFLVDANHASRAIARGIRSRAVWASGADAAAA